MMNILLLVLLGFICVASEATGRIYSLNSSTFVDKEICPQPTRHISLTNDGYEVEYSFDYLQIVEDYQSRGCTLWKIPGFGLNERIGEPAYLRRYDTFELSESEEVSIEIIEEEFEIFSTTLSPASKPCFIGNVSSSTATQVKIVDKNFPAFPVQISHTDNYRGQPTVTVCFSPMQYNPASKEIRFYKRLKYRLVGNSNVNLSQRLDKLGEDDPNFQNNVFTKSGGLEIVRTKEDNATYLILTYTDLEETFEDFAEWKRHLGYNVTYYIKDKWTQADIKNIIRRRYDEYEDLRYVLILGDNFHIPGVYKDEDEDNKYFTDYEYGCVESETTPSVMVGRMPASNREQAATMLSKAIEYEKGTRAHSSNYNRGIHSAFFDEIGDEWAGYEKTCMVSTSELIRNYVTAKNIDVKRVYSLARPDISPSHWHPTLYGNGDTIPFSLRKPFFQWNGTGDDLRNFFETGASYVMVNSHGATTRWADPKFTFREALALDNQGKGLPVVFSTSCLVGEYQFEENLCKSLLVSPKGGAAMVIGASGKAYSGYADALFIGLFDAIYPNPGLLPNFGYLNVYNNPSPTPPNLYTIGQYLFQAKKRMGETYGYDEYYHDNQTKQMEEIMHIFGDPSSILYLGTPGVISNPEICRDLNGINIKLAEKSFICLYNFKDGTVKRYLGSTLNYTTSTPENYNITICSPGKTPYRSIGKNYLSGITEGQNPKLTSFEITRSSATTIDVCIGENENGALEEYKLIILDSFGNTIITMAINAKTVQVDISKLPQGVCPVLLYKGSQIQGSKYFVK